MMKDDVIMTYGTLTAVRSRCNHGSEIGTCRVVMLDRVYISNV